jgi:hypothetical protein
MLRFCKRSLDMSGVSTKYRVHNIAGKDSNTKEDIAKWGYRWNRKVALKIRSLESHASHSAHTTHTTHARRWATRLLLWRFDDGDLGGTEK